MASRTSTDPLEILVEMGVDLDDLSEQDYLGALMEAVATIEFQTKGKGDARSAVLRKEIIKVRKNRKAADPKFKAKKTKISANSFKKGSATGSNVAPKALPSSAIVAYQKPEAKEKKEEKKEAKKKGSPPNLIAEIAETVTRIADILKDQYDLKRDTATFDRKKAEREKRDLQKKNLAKRFEGLKKVAEKIIAPVRGIFDRIMGFLFNILLGKFLMKLVDWFSNPDNKSKINSIIRFLSNNWPKLLSAYIIFGTGLGKFSRFIVKILARGAIRLAAATAGLLARLFGSRALGKFSRFFGRRGKLIAGGIEAVSTIVAFKALEGALTKGLGPEESASIDNDIPVSGYSGGGLVQPIFKFGGGGKVNLNLISPIGYNEGGEVDGPSGTDQVPAMLTDGEFVMSRGAVQKFGVGQLEAMNAAGGGTNVPKVMNGTVYAANGGHIGFRDTQNYKGEQFINRFIMGDKSLLNQLALGNLSGVLTSLGIKIDKNTEATNRNTNQRREESKQRREDLFTVEGLISGAIGIAQSLEQQAAGLYNQAMSGAAQLANELPAKMKEGYDSEVRRFYATTANADRMRDAEAERYVTQAEFDKLSPEEQLDKLVIGATNKDGVVMSTKTALTARNQERQTATIERLRKGLNSENPFERFTSGIMNEGMIALPSQILKNLEATEGFDKAISGLSGGRIKKASAAMSAVEMTLKGLLGPLGMPFQTDASSILEYNKPLMDFAIENNLVNSKGEFLVGKDSWSEILGDKAYEMVKDPETGRMVRGEHLYDKMQRESMGSGAAAKIANYGLGQFAFSVDRESGKAKVTDSWDSNNSAAYYFGESEEALKRGDVYNALFKGFSGLLRVNQNSFLGYGDTGFANTLPAGIDITSRSGFLKALTSSPSAMRKESKQVAQSSANKGYFSSTTGQFYPSYADALKDPRVNAAAQIEETKKKFSFAPNQQPNLTIPGMPTNASGSNVTVIKTSSKDKSASGNTGGSEVPNANPGQGNRGKWNILGMSIPALF